MAMRNSGRVALLLVGVAIGAGVVMLGASEERPPPAVPEGPERDLVLLAAIEQAESGGQPGAWNEEEDAVGVLQIRAVMVEDVNRILGEERYQLSDRWDPARSREMFWIYADHYSPAASREVLTRRWSGGPDGASEPATLDAWARARAYLPK